MSSRGTGPAGRAGTGVAIGLAGALVLVACGSSDAKEDVAITRCAPGGAAGAATTGVPAATSPYPTVSATVRNTRSKTGRYTVTFGFYLGDKKVTSTRETQLSVSSHSTGTLSVSGQAPNTSAGLTCKVTKASRSLSKKSTGTNHRSTPRRRHR